MASMRTRPRTAESWLVAASMLRPPVIALNAGTAREITSTIRPMTMRISVRVKARRIRVPYEEEREGVAPTARHPPGVPALPKFGLRRAFMAVFGLRVEGVDVVVARAE